MLTVLSIFLPLFSTPTYRNFLFLFTAHTLCKGRRTVTELLKRMGLRNIKNFSRYHEFFSKAKWSPLRAAEILFIRLVSLAGGEILISIDSTIERRKGPKIKGLGIQRDPVRSSRSRKVLVPGLNWLVCAIHIKFPWCNRTWALPFLSILMPPENPLSTSLNHHDLNKTKKHKTMTKWTCQVVILLRKWLGPNKKITIVADNAFATYVLANTCIDHGVELVSRMRTDARMFEFPSKRNGRGRKNLVGKRLPTFKMMLEDPTMEWGTKEFGWYGGERKKMEFLTGTCLWYGYGIRPVPITWILTREPGNSNTGAVIFSTAVDLVAENIIESFVCRWQLEVTFEEVRRHLGMETQRQWSDSAIDKITPCILASFSIINLIALESLAATGQNIPIQTSSWYKKTHVTFSDVLAYIRGEIMDKKYFPQFEKNTDLWEFDLKEMIKQMAAA